MPNVLSQFPDLKEVLSQRDLLASRISVVIDLLPEDAAQVFGSLTDEVSKIQGVMPTDPSDFTNSLSSIFRDLSALLPSESSEIVQAALQVLNQAIELLNNSQIKELLDSEGGFNDVKDLIFNKVGDIVGSIDTTLSDITEKILPVESLELILSFVQAIANFETAIPSDPTKIAEFIARFFVNVPYDLLEQPLNLRKNLFDKMDSIINTTSFDTAKSSVTQGLTSVQDDISNIDLENNDSFQVIIDALNNVQSDMATLQSALTELFSSFQSGLEALSLSDFPNQLKSLMEGMPEIRVARADDFTTIVVEQIQSLNQLLEEADPAQIASTLRDFTNQVKTGLEGLGITELRDSFLQFFRNIGELIDDLDVNSLRQSVESIFTSAEERIDAFSLDILQQTICNIFEQIGAFIDEIDLSSIQTAVEHLVQEIHNGLDDIPLEGFQSLLLGIIEQVQRLMAEVSSELGAVIPQIKTAIECFGEIDFDPVVEPVTAQIREMKAQVQEIDISALSSPLKSLLKKAVGFLKEMDFSGTISKPLLEKYDSLGPKALLDAILKKIQTLLNKVDETNPETIFAPLDTFIGQMTEALQRYSPSRLMDPAISEFDKAKQSIMDQISPKKMMEPIQKIFDDFINFLSEYSPSKLLSPIAEIYQEINEYIEKIDPAPILQEIENLQTSWFDNATSSLKQVTRGLKASLGDSIEISDFVSKIDTTIDLMNPQIFVDPLATINSMSASLEDFKPGDLLSPLSGLFNRLMTVFDSISNDALVEGINKVKQRLVDSIEDLLPLNLMFEVPKKLEEVLDSVDVTYNPQLLMEINSAYVGVVNAFDSIVPDKVSPELQSRYDEIWSLITGLDPISTFDTFSDTFANLKSQISELCQAFDLENLFSIFGDVADKLESLVPEFLRQNSLTAESIRAALQELNPSRVIEEANAAYDSLLQKVQSLMPTLMPEIENLMNIVKENLLIITPKVFSTALNEITEPLKKKLETLNPEQIIQALDETYNRIIGKLQPLNPSSITEQLDGVFSILEDKLDQLKNQGLVLLKESLETIWSDVLKRLDPLKPEVLREPVMEPFQQIKSIIKEIDIEGIFAVLAGNMQQLRNALEVALQKTEKDFQAMVLAIPI